MTEIFYTRLRQPVTLDKKLASGGEGEVWQTDRIGTVAKLFYQPDTTRLEKLQNMIQLPPADPMKKHDHVSIPWPQELIFDVAGKFKGYLMPCISGGMTLNNVYNAKLRNQKAPGFNWYYLHVAALNVASIIDALHTKGYVIGDVKTDNFLVNNQALVSVIDTDSFQVRGSSRTFRSLVASDGFTPPELITKDMKRFNRRPEHDAFGLAVIIYMLLTGDHPFSGQWAEGIEPLDRDAAIAGGIWPHGPQKLLQPSILSVPLSYLDLDIQKAFHQTFTEGHRDPTKRLTAKKWCQYLTSALKSLKVCQKNRNHYYHANQAECSWCVRAKAFGYDSFPSQTNKSELESYHEFLRAADNNDHQQMIQLWKTVPELHSLGELEGYREKMNGLIRELGNIESFAKACQEQSRNAVEIMRIWQSNPAWHSLIDQGHYKVGKQPLREYINQLTQNEEEKNVLIRLLNRCDERFNLKKAYVEEEDQLHQRLKSYLKETELNESNQMLFDRMDLAKNRTKAWQKISAALKEDEQVAYNLWVENKSLLDGFVQVHDQIEFFNNLEVQMKVLNKLKNKIENKQSHEEILTLWELYPSLMKSDFVKQYSIGDTALQDHIQLYYQKRDLFKKLRKARQSGEVEQVRHLWNSDLCDEACFKPFEQFLTNAHENSNHWARIRAAALEDEYETVVNYWDEKFTSRAYQSGIQEKIQRAFQVQFGFKKNIHHTGQKSVFMHRDFNEIVYGWPLENATEPSKLSCTHLVFCARPDRFPETPDDIKEPIYYRVIGKGEAKDKYARILFPVMKGNYYFSVFPATVICGRVVEIDEPYQFMAPTKYPEIKYAFFRKKHTDQNSLFLQVFSSEKITVPPFAVTYDEERPKHYFEENQKVLAEMDAVSCDAGESLIEIHTQQKLPDDAFVSIYVRDRSFYDTVRVINLSLDAVV
ncbi:MAG: hypothetical protein CMO49_01300 [Verrucomicrobiales bacterium]|nr:hypothetical protein [Verrucomicrobiales bacterium]|tara:strand:- start:15486 stop:18278 length:2793 start_codon:yes stop_codon:yes gene_type:complete